MWLSPELSGRAVENGLSAITGPRLMIRGAGDEYATLRQLDALERASAARPDGSCYSGG
ncbi:hypothetical protein ACGF8B_35690 [Streptomyces sp. NPDC047917]|uniref:hypothetical protein n=1 Tax=Streptomyces sp. NPDC047917 TaxID=3365491 RepID=UPI00371930D7